MAITVLSRPLGLKIIEDAVTATITNSSGDALLTKTAHSLIDGDYIYVSGIYNNYNGFWLVDSISSNTFKIKNDLGDYVSYVSNASITYYQTLSHTWHSAFLPIVYNLSNDKWPTNSVDTARTVSSFTNDAGYTNLNLSGALSAFLYDLDFIKISGASDSTLNRTYQIINAITTSDITIDLNYDSGYSFAGATVQYYYNNYHIKVEVYGGLPSGHALESFKPSELLSTLNLIPDDNNLIKFSINEIVKSKLTIRNNATGATLPNNLDAYSSFYIKYAESYDESDGTEVTTYLSSYTSDAGNFQGWTVAGVLPFKNAYAGAYSNYIHASGLPASWLITQDKLVGIPGYFLDLSFIHNTGSNFDVEIDRYNSADILIDTEVTSYTSQGIGVYRIPIEFDSSFDKYIVRIVNNLGDAITQDICIDIMEACAVADGISEEDCIRITEDGCFRILEECPEDMPTDITFSFGSITYLVNVDTFKEGSFQLVNDIPFTGPYNVTLELHVDTALTSPGDANIEIYKNGVMQHSLYSPGEGLYVTETFTLSNLIDSDIILIYFKVAVIPGGGVQPGCNVWVRIDDLTSSIINPIKGSPNLYSFHVENAP